MPLARVYNTSHPSFSLSRSLLLSFFRAGIIREKEEKISRGSRNVFSYGASSEKDEIKTSSSSNSGTKKKKTKESKKKKKPSEPKMCLEGAITREQRERLEQTEREDLEKAFSKKLSLVDDGKSGGGRKASSSSSSSKKNADAATTESSDLREVIEKKRAGASAEKGVGKSGGAANKEQQHAQSPSTKNSRQRRAEMRKENREGAQETKKKSSDKSTSVAQAATAASEVGKKKKKEEEEKNTADEEGPPGYPQPKYSDYLAKKETEKEEETKKKEYTSPFAHILQCAPTPLPPSFDTPQGARGEGFVLGDRDKVPTSLFNVDSTWQGSAAFAPPTKLARESIKSIPSFTPGTPVKTNNNNNNNKPRERIQREEKDDHLTANDLYKTELCRSWIETGECRYNDKCQFAHGRDELRCVVRHPKYKTQVCRTYTTTGQCPYGNRCRFIHEKLPEKGVLGTLATNGHYVITEDWKPGGGKDPLCLRKNVSGEFGDIAVTEDSKDEDDTPKRLGIFRHITHDESLSLSEGQSSPPSSTTSAEEGEIRGARTYQEQDQQHQRANQNLEFEGFAGPIPRTPDLSKRYF